MASKFWCKSGDSTPLLAFMVVFFKRKTSVFFSCQKTKKRRQEEEKSISSRLCRAVCLQVSLQGYTKGDLNPKITEGIAIACKSCTTPNPQLAKMGKLCWNGCAGYLVDFSRVVLVSPQSFPSSTSLQHSSTLSIFFPPLAPCISSTVFLYLGWQ